MLGRLATGSMPLASSAGLGPCQVSPTLSGAPKGVHRRCLITAAFRYEQMISNMTNPLESGATTMESPRDRHRSLQAGHPRPWSGLQLDPAAPSGRTRMRRTILVLVALVATGCLVAA